MAYEYTDEYVKNLKKYIKYLRKYYEEKSTQDIGMSKEDRIEASKFLLGIERTVIKFSEENIKFP